VRFLEFVEENDRERLATNCLRELPSFFESDVGRGSSSESSDGVAFRVF
jgi:hypothetical protein